MTDAAYDAIAAWYDDLVSSGNLAGDLVTASLFALLGGRTMVKRFVIWPVGRAASRVNWPGEAHRWLALICQPS